MQNCINLKYLALSFILSLSLTTHCLYGVITSQGDAAFTNATNIGTLEAFSNGSQVGAPPWAPSQNVNRIQWGTPFQDGDEKSAYSLQNDFAADVQLDQLFRVATVTHHNRDVFIPAINEFAFHLSVLLTIDGTPLPEITYSNIRVVHTESLNAVLGQSQFVVDTADFQNVGEVREFTFNNFDYTMQLFGFTVNTEMGNPCFGKSCFSTPEVQDTSAGVFAIIKREGVPIPEPRTYLIAGSMIAIVLLAKSVRTRRIAKKERLERVRMNRLKK